MAACTCIYIDEDKQWIQVDVERLASSLPLHVMACVASSGAEPRIRYWLRAVRLLHSLSTLAHGYPKLSQV